MNPRHVRTAADARAIVEQRELSHVKVGAFDIDGILRGKYMSRAKFESSLESGFGFCDVVLGGTAGPAVRQRALHGWHTGYPDAMVRIVPESCRRFRGRTPSCFSSPNSPARRRRSAPGDCCPCVGSRPPARLPAVRRFEYEFFVFSETPDSVREKNYRNLKPIAPGNFGYSVIRNSVGASSIARCWKPASGWIFRSRACTRKPGPA